MAEEKEKTIKQELKEYLERDLKKPETLSEEIIECFLWHRKVRRQAVKMWRLAIFIAMGTAITLILVMLIYLFGGAL